MGLDPVDVVIFAPHPDDEVLGAAGVVRHALDSGKRVRVVFATNGDAYPKAAAALTKKPVENLVAGDYLELAATRQHEAVTADGLLGLPAGSLTFLGYPDGVLGEVYADNTDQAVVSRTTSCAATYGPVQADFHTLTHGQPAPYTHAAALADVEEVLLQSRPTEVYVTDPADTHPDHRAMYDLVCESVVAGDYRGRLLSYLIHSGSGWPWPEGPTPTMPFASHVSGGVAYPVGVVWPPPIRVPLTAAESDLKLRAIRAHASQWSVDRLYMESFIKSEEVFWG